MLPRPPRVFPYPTLENAGSARRAQSLRTTPSTRVRQRRGGGDERARVAPTSPASRSDSLRMSWDKRLKAPSGSSTSICADPRIAANGLQISANSAESRPRVARYLSCPVHAPCGAVGGSGRRRIPLSRSMPSPTSRERAPRASRRAALSGARLPGPWPGRRSSMWRRPTSSSVVARMAWAAGW